MDRDYAYVVTPFPIYERGDARRSRPEMVVMHAKFAGGTVTLCGRPTIGWHAYMVQEFTAVTGARCGDCKEELERLRTGPRSQ